MPPVRAVLKTIVFVDVIWGAPPYYWRGLSWIVNGLLDLYELIITDPGWYPAAKAAAAAAAATATADWLLLLLFWLFTILEWRLFALWYSLSYLIG